MYCAALDPQNLLVWPCMALKHLGIHKSKISGCSLCLKLNLWKFHVNFPANLPTKEFMNRTVLDYFCLVLWDTVYKTYHSVFIFFGRFCMWHSLLCLYFCKVLHVTIFVRFCTWHLPFCPYTRSAIGSSPPGPWVDTSPGPGTRSCCAVSPCSFSNKTL